MRIELDYPNVGDLEKQYLNRCIDSEFVSTFGPWVQEFEEKFGNYIACPHTVSTQSGTAGLHMALHELGIGPGDEVIVPVTTFVASVHPIMYVGATPVFVDIDLKTWNMDVNQVEDAITSKTKAILPVHLYGNPCDMDAILTIAKKHNLFVVEDAAESLGGTYNGKMTGTLGDIGVFSFNGNKVMTTGGGGMVCSPDAEKIKHIQFLVNQARDVSKGYYHPEVGFNYRMTNLEASMGLAQLERLPEFLEKKQQFATLYKENLADVEEISFQQEPEGGISSWWLISVSINSKKYSIEEIQLKLKEKKIPTRRVFMPITVFPPYQEFASQTYPNAERLYNTGLNLPSSTVNDNQSIPYICETIVNQIL